MDLLPDFAEAYRMRGRAFMAESDPGSWPSAISLAAGRIAARDTPALVERGFARLDQKDYASAIADAGRAIALNPKIARAYNLRAQRRRATGDPRSAHRRLQQGRRVEPNLDNYFQRASTYQKLGEHRIGCRGFQPSARRRIRSSLTFTTRGRSPGPR